MIVKGTKKLLDYLKIEPEGSSMRETEVDAIEKTYDPELISWYANMITIQRNNILILLNEKTRFVVILQDIKAVHRKNIRVLIKDAVKDALEKECFNAHAINEYLIAMGEVEFQKTTDRSMLGKVKSSAEDIYGFGYELMDFKRMAQGDLSRNLNSNGYRDSHKNIYTPIELMIEEFKAFSPDEELIQVDAVELKITLNLLNQDVWRKVVLPLNTPFEKFHMIIQTLFSWQDYHMHEFHILHEDQIVQKLVPDDDMIDFPDSIDRRLEEGVELTEYLPQNQKLKYIYDFGDYWEHDIELIRHLPKHNHLDPYCIDGAGRTPPEDVGGQGGYEEFLEIINDPSHPMRKEMLSWGEMQEYSDFDLKSVNQSLRHITG